MVKVIETVSEMQSYTGKEKSKGNTVALVPTMGALHAGHMALVKTAKARADKVVASIFVNPTQFNNPDDLKAYPRTWEADLAKLNTAEADAVFYPAAEEMYPQGYATTVCVDSPITQTLEGAHRPGHFDGVATVVSKLFMAVQPDLALFGEKDYQQLQLIKRFTRDLNMPIKVRGVPTVREEDGLALSSRNVRLTEQERKIAPALHHILQNMAQALLMGERDYQNLEQKAADKLLQSGFSSVDYIAIRRADNLSIPSNNDNPADLRILAAADLGTARLIDNIAVLHR